MQIFVRDRRFYRNFFTIAVPVVLQSLITIGINMTDTVMLGTFGEVQISGSSLANQFYNIFQILCMGMGFGTAVMTSQYWGRGDTASLKRVFTLMLRLCIVIAGCFTLVTTFFPARILRFYTPEPAVIEAGVRYYRFLSLTFLFQGLSLTSTIILRSIGAANIPLLSSALSFSVNIFFNWVFIFGKLGAPRMEIAGAAVGTLIARMLECCIIWGYLFFHEKKLRYRPADLLLPCGDYIKPYLTYSAPAIVSDLLLALGNNAVAIIMGHIGSAFVAGNAITVVTMQLSTVFVQGIANASSIMTGHTLGMGDRERAYREGVSFLGLAILVGLCASAFITLAAPVIVGFYNITEETREIALQLMRALGIIVTFNAVAGVMTKGVLRGGGDTRFLMVADVLFLWCASVPLGMLAGLVWQLEPFWVYCCLMIDRVIKSIWCVFRLRSKKWMKVI